MRHGLPDAPRTWSLDRREKRSKGLSDGIPVATCSSCLSVYERIYRSCPFCGVSPIPQLRSGPEFVDGDLLELDAATLARMRGEVDTMDQDKELLRAQLASKYIPTVGQMSMVKKHVTNQQAQTALRDRIALWAGYQRAMSRPDSESYRRFYFQYGVDVMTAKTLKAVDAVELLQRVDEDIRINYAG